MRERPVPGQGAGRSSFLGMSHDRPPLPCGREDPRFIQLPSKSDSPQLPGFHTASDTVIGFGSSFSLWNVSATRCWSAIAAASRGATP